MRRSRSIGGERYDIGVHGRTPLVKVFCLAVAAAALAALAGCPSDSTAPTLASATSRYDEGQYERALREGEAVVSRGPASDRPQADLIAGMAAFQLDRFDQAERHFLAAERSGEPAIRGRARVMLANIRLEQGRTSDAASLFESGASDLTGADADKARRYASLAREGQLGTGEPETTVAESRAPAAPGKPPSQSPAPAAPTKVAAAPTSKAAAAPKAPAPSPSRPPRAATAPPAAAPPAAAPASIASASSLFTVRAGAYTTEAAARRRMKALAADIRRAKSPEPYIAPVATKDGDTLYAVRIGTFKSRADAESLLKKLARKDLAVGAL